MNRLAVLILILLCSACVAAPTGAPTVVFVDAGHAPLPAEVERLSAEWTATAAMQATQSAATATALPAEQTEAAIRVTQTAADVGVTQTHAAETPTAAAVALQMTQAVSAATSTSIAELNYSSLAFYATATEVKAQANHSDRQRALESATAWVWIAAGVIAAGSLVILLLAALLSLARFSRVRLRFLVVSDDLYDVEERRFLRGGAIEAEPTEVPAEDESESVDPAAVAYYRAYAEAIIGAATLAGLVGGWSISRMCRQFPRDARPISEDDRELIVGKLVQAKILIVGRGTDGTDYAPGENFMSVKDGVTTGRVIIPPYSEGVKPPPKVDISLAQRYATQRDAEQGSVFASPMAEKTSV